MTFKTFSADEIWGVRKVCIEHMASMLKFLKYNETLKLNECFEFFKKCLVDANRWVKNQVLVQYGPIVHQIYLKIESIPENEKE